MFTTCIKCRIMRIQFTKIVPWPEQDAGRRTRGAGIPLKPNIEMQVDTKHIAKSYLNVVSVEIEPTYST